MHELRQSVFYKGVLLLLLIMSPVDLDSRLRSGRPPSHQRSLTGGTHRASVAGRACIATVTAADNSSESANDARFSIILASDGACTGSEMDWRYEQLLTPPSIGSGLTGVGAAGFGPDTLKWGGSGDFAGAEVCQLTVKLASL